MQLLDALRFGGPATASQLAEKLGELAAHGFVEDDPERGKGRERWWKAAVQGLRFDDALLRDPSPDVRGAADLYLHEVATQQTRELSTWLGTREEWSDAWNRSTDMSSWTLRLTPQLAGELAHKMHDLIESYRDRPDVTDDPEASTVRVQSRAFPISTD